MKLDFENETVEYKKSTGELKEGVISLSSMLNKHGIGTLYFGVNNKGEVVGQNISETTLRDVSKAIAENIKPQIYPIVQKVELDNKQVIKVEVNGEEVPYSAYGKYYLRTADEDRDITPTELAKMIKKNNALNSFEIEDSGEVISDVDTNSLKKFLNESIEARRLPNEKYKNNVLLEKLGLVKDENLNNAGRLLFSKKEPVMLKMAVFATDDKITFIDKKIVEDNIINLIDIAEKYIYEHIDWKVEIGSGARKEIPEIPRAAIRELVSNFFAHAIYYSMTYHEIDIHPSFITIYNPGTFASEYEPEEYSKGMHPSFIRNKLIAKTLYLFNRIEQFGSGLKRVIKLLTDAKIKYKFHNSLDGFKVTIYRKRNSSSTLKRDLTETEMQTLELLRLDGHCTANKISEKIGKTPRTVQRVIRKLVEKKYIKRIGENKNGHWEIN